ncbi:hypothetical protein ACQEV2_21855 [Streptomyces sp. CA-251387]|uniref:hypothetical protein n=1 Tax=Streptomyces sp. CA-251387 TaxID=3240064 RepID=UPI003D913B24
MLERTSTTERYTRGVAAAVVAVVTLILAANAGPARAADPGAAYQVKDVVPAQHPVPPAP